MKRLIPRLPRELWLLQGVRLTSNVAAGVLLPFELVYLHNVRGFSLPVAGAILATWPAAALAGGLAAGPLLDRLGPRRPAVGCGVAIAAATAGLAFAVDPWHALVCQVALGLAQGVATPTQSTLVAALVESRALHAAYGVDFAVTNLGLALGAALGGAVAVVSRPETFSALFIANGVLFLGCALLVAVLTRGLDIPRTDRARTRGGYRAVVRLPGVTAFVALTFVFAVAGVALWEVGLAAYALNHAALSAREVSWLFVVNSIVICAAQLPLARLLEGRRRLRVIAVALALWAVAWLLVPGAGLATLAAVAVLFALGECLIAPVQGALLVDLAPPELRGRCFALQSTAYGVGFTAGPVAYALALQYQPGALWPAAAAVLAVAVVGLLALETTLPAHARRVAQAAPA